MALTRAPARRPRDKSTGPAGARRRPLTAGPRDSQDPDITNGSRLCWLCGWSRLARSFGGWLWLLCGWLDLWPVAVRRDLGTGLGRSGSGPIRRLPRPLAPPRTRVPTSRARRARPPARRRVSRTGAPAVGGPSSAGAASASVGPSAVVPAPLGARQTDESSSKLTPSSMCWSVARTTARSLGVGLSRRCLIGKSETSRRARSRRQMHSRMPHRSASLRCSASSRLGREQAWGDRPRLPV